MINGAFYFAKSQADTSDRIDTVHVGALSRVEAFRIGYVKQMVQRVYQMTTGNNMAIPACVAAPGCRYLTCATAPWLYRSAVEGVKCYNDYDGITVAIPGTERPILRERLMSIEISYGDNGVANATALTASQSETLSSDNPFMNATSTVRKNLGQAATGNVTSINK